jgi:hypothetical protein
MPKYYVTDRDGKLVSANAGAAYEYVLLTRSEWTTLRDDLKKSETVLKIARERANRDRNLRPREQRSGYLFISTQSRYDKKQELWKTQLQTPYGIGYANIIGSLVRDDFDRLDLWSKLGLTEYAYLEYRVDGKLGYWIVTVTHSDPCAVIDPDLLPVNKDSRHK